MRRIAPVVWLLLPSSHITFLMKGNLAVFDVSSQGHDLVGVHISLIKFLLFCRHRAQLFTERSIGRIC